MLYNFYALLLVTLPNYSVWEWELQIPSCHLNMLSNRVWPKNACRKRNAVCLCFSWIQNNTVRRNRSPIVVISNVKYLQAKRWLLYNFNKLSSFSNILVYCLLKLSLVRSSVCDSYISLACDVKE